MKPILISIILVTIFAFGNINLSIAQTPEQLYQKGLGKEEGEGALQDAINLFNQVADNPKADKSLQAKALLHTGMCYEKLGMKEATKAYQRLVSNFPAQKTEVAIARERLSRLVTTESSGDMAVMLVLSGPGVDGLGSVSSDRDHLTFIDWVTGNLAMNNLKTGEITQLTNEASWVDTTQWAEYSLISPDGKLVAYNWYNKQKTYDLRIVKTGDPTSTVLYSCNKDEYITPEIWYSDNKRIIAQKYNSKTKVWHMLYIDIVSREVRQLSEKMPGSSFLSNISVSPDEKYIAFDFPNPADKGGADIYLLSADGKQEIPFIVHPANDRLLGWFRDRDELLFTSDRSGATDVWAIETSFDKPSVMPKRTLTNVGDIDPLGFTRDGSLFYAISSSNIETFLIPLDPDNGKPDTDSRVPLSGPVYDVCWMPDGINLICCQNLPEPDKTRRLKLFIINTMTNEARGLADNINVSSQPRISPDGRSVLIIGRDKKRLEDLNYKGGIYIVDISTGIPVEIKIKYDFLTLSNSVEWDKTGRSIFCLVNNQLIKHNIETGADVVIYNDERLNRPVLTRSLDGSRLFFDVVVDLNTNLHGLLSIPENGGDPVTLSTYNVVSGWRFKRVAVSPDGKHIYISALDSTGLRLLCRIPVSGGKPEKIWQAKTHFIAGLSIHPEGKKIALSLWEPGTEIRAIENLTTEVDKIFLIDE